MPNLTIPLSKMSARQAARRLRRFGFETLTPSGLAVLEGVLVGLTKIQDIADWIGNYQNQVMEEFKRLKMFGLITFENFKARTVQSNYRFIKAEDL